jgi:hypothetical protein
VSVGRGGHQFGRRCSLPKAGFPCSVRWISLLWHAGNFRLSSGFCGSTGRRILRKWAFRAPFPAVFPVIREFHEEPGSIPTASTTTRFGEGGDFPKGKDIRRVGGFSGVRLVCRRWQLRFGPVVWPSVSGLGNPFPLKAAQGQQRFGSIRASCPGRPGVRPRSGVGHLRQFHPGRRRRCRRISSTVPLGTINRRFTFDPYDKSYIYNRTAEWCRRLPGFS